MTGTAQDKPTNQSWWWCGLVAAQLCAGTGCTAVGMLAGHGVDRATSVPDSPSGPNAAATLRSGTDVCLDVNESGSRRICGRFLGFAQTGSGGFAGLLLLVETPDNIELVDATHVQQVFLPGPQYGWAYGGAVGLALDAALILAASQMNFGSDGAGWQF